MAAAWINALATLVDQISVCTDELHWLRGLDSALGSFAPGTPGLSIMSVMVHARPQASFHSRWLTYSGGNILRCELADVLWVYQRCVRGTIQSCRAALWQVKFRKPARSRRNPSYRVEMGQVELLANLPPFSLDGRSSAYCLAASPFIGWICYAQAPAGGRGSIATLCPARFWPRIGWPTGAQAMRQFLVHLSGAHATPLSADLLSDIEACRLVRSVLWDRTHRQPRLRTIFEGLCRCLPASGNLGAQGGGAGEHSPPGVETPERGKPLLIVRILEEESQ